MNKYFKIGAARCKSMGVPEGTVFPVKQVITNMVGGKGFDASVILDTGDGWFNGEYIGKDVEMFVARGEFVEAPKQQLENDMGRKISEYINDAGTKKAIVYRKQGEYVVCFYNKDDKGMMVWNPDADYFTDDKDDAIATALYEVSKV